MSYYTAEDKSILKGSFPLKGSVVVMADEIIDKPL
jgi:hypothetical protein